MLSDPAPARTPTAAGFARGLLSRDLAEFLRREARVRVTDEAEALHAARTQARRLRTVLRGFRCALPADFALPAAELRAFARASGLVRDADVLRQRLLLAARRAPPAEAAALEPLLSAVARRRADERAALLELIAEPRHAELLRAWQSSLADGLEDPPSGAQPIEAFGARLLRRRWRRFRRAIRRLAPDAPATDFHAARLQAKRMRDSLDALEPIFGRPAARMAVAVRPLCDRLGELQDLEAGEARLREALDRSLGTWPAPSLIASGALLERMRARGDALRARGAAPAARLRRRWRRLRRDF